MVTRWSMTRRAVVLCAVLTVAASAAWAGSRGDREPPSDAVVLFDGTKASLERNWCDKKGRPTKWKYSEEGFFFCDDSWKTGDILTRTAFGDCQLHIEFRHDPKALSNDSGMRGNSGVFFMGPSGYEVQVLESYGTSDALRGKDGFFDFYADGVAGAVYAENPPLVNPARKPGEWQVYDIIFHPPVWKGRQLVRRGDVTVFFNGVLVQDGWEMEGMATYRHRRPLLPHPAKGPIALQDHGSVVQYRNVWCRPIAARRDAAAVRTKAAATETNATETKEKATL